MNLRRHLTYANVVSSLCLFLLLGGGAAYAGMHLTKSSVGTNQLKAEAVTKGKLHPNSVNSKKVVNGSLTGADIDSATLGKVPSATSAEHATSAETATNATHADSANTATNAEKLDGHAPGEFGPVLVSSTETEVELSAEAYFSVSGVFTKTTSVGAVAITLPNLRLRAADFAVHLESEVEASAAVHVSLVVNGSAEEVCTVTVVPGACTPSTAAIDIPAGAQLAWKLSSPSPVKARPEFALRLLPN